MDRVTEVRIAVGRRLDQILEHFKPGTKISVVVRPPMHKVEGDTDFVLGDDDLDGAIAVLERRKAAESDPGQLSRMKRLELGIESLANLVISLRSPANKLVPAAAGGEGRDCSTASEQYRVAEERSRRLVPANRPNLDANGILRNLDREAEALLSPPDSR